MSSVRLATPADAAALVPVLKHLSCLISDGSDRDLPASIAKFVTGAGQVFVAELDGRIQAAAVVYVLPLVGSARAQWLVDDLVVHPDARGNGLGGVLVDAILGKAKSARVAQVSARIDPGEPAGGRVYAARGFVPGDALVVWSGA